MIKIKSRNETQIFMAKLAKRFDDFVIRNEVMINYIIGVAGKIASVFRLNYYGLNLITIIGKLFLLEKK